MDKSDLRKIRQNKLTKRKKIKPEIKCKTNVKEEPVEQLPNNWSRYKLCEDSDDYDSSCADFENLIEQPFSQASYFKFKFEENWTNTIQLHEEFSKYFTLDLKLLGKGISCVPCDKRYSSEVCFFLIVVTNCFISIAPVTYSLLRIIIIIYNSYSTEKYNQY